MNRLVFILLTAQVGRLVNADIIANMLKIYDECSTKNYSLDNCFKTKAVTLLDRIDRSDLIKLDESVSIVRDSDRADYARASTEQDLQPNLENSDQNTMGEKLNQMLYDRFSRLLSSHVVKIGFPQVDPKEIMRSLEQGRGKMKKTMGMFMTLLMMKAMMMIPMAIGLLFILAGKALIISKIALILSLLITLKKLLSKPTEHVVHESHGWGGSGSGGWDRRFQNGPNLAYSAHITH